MNFFRAEELQVSRLVEIGKLVLRKDLLSGSLTGLVVAGFGAGEIFPTLVSFEVDGIVGNRLKYVETNFVDIDRNGPKARVIPFAQKEMVERFLYGLDEGIQRQITTFCTTAIVDIRNHIVQRVAYTSEDDKNEFEKEIQIAEEAFVSGLGQKLFRKSAHPPNPQLRVWSNLCRSRSLRRWLRRW